MKCKFGEKHAIDVASGCSAHPAKIERSLYRFIRLIQYPEN